MNEKILAEGRITTRDLKKFVLITLVVLVIVSLLTFGMAGVYFIIENIFEAKYSGPRYYPHDSLSYFNEWLETSPIGPWLEFSVSEGFHPALIVVPILGGVFIFSLLTYLYARKMHIVVSNKRVYGESVFGRKVDLPIDSISAIGKKWFKGIGVATSAGKIVFFGFKNRDEIYETVSNLLVKRQSSNQAMNTSQSSADELSKYKKLLDDGVISQEEFNEKKKQLLDF